MLKPTITASAPEGVALKRMSVQHENTNTGAMEHIHHHNNHTGKKRQSAGHPSQPMTHRKSVAGQSSVQTMQTGTGASPLKGNIATTAHSMKTIQPTLHQPMVVHETFSIPQLERKMMFLNEPAIQNHTSARSVPGTQDQIKHIWRVSSLQMQFQNQAIQQAQEEQQIGAGLSQGGKSRNATANNIALSKPDTLEEISGKSSFMAVGQRPKDFHRFQTVVRTQIRDLQTAHNDLRTKFKSQCGELEIEMMKINGLTSDLHHLFNDFISCFNDFVGREERLETLHTQAIKKSKELNKRIQLEILASDQQRSRLLDVIDTLQSQLTTANETRISKTLLSKEQETHEKTRVMHQKAEQQIKQLQIDLSKLKLEATWLQAENHTAEQDRLTFEKQMVELKSKYNAKEGEVLQIIQERNLLTKTFSDLKQEHELAVKQKDQIIDEQSTKLLKMQQYRSNRSGKKQKEYASGESSDVVATFQPSSQKEKSPQNIPVYKHTSNDDYDDSYDDEYYDQELQREDRDTLDSAENNFYFYKFTPGQLSPVQEQLAAENADYFSNKHQFNSAREDQHPSVASLTDKL